MSASCRCCPFFFLVFFFGLGPAVWCAVPLLRCECDVNYRPLVRLLEGALLLRGPRL
jgi:hypothetical protein